MRYTIQNAKKRNIYTYTNTMVILHANGEPNKPESIGLLLLIQVSPSITDIFSENTGMPQAYDDF